MSAVQHVVCLVQDPDLRRTLRRTLGATGSEVEFVERPEAAHGPARIVFVDTASRKACSVEALSRLLGAGGRIVILGDSLEDDELVRLLKDDALDHVITDERVPDESELVVTSGKLLTGDVFGLEKYLSWGAQIHEVAVTSKDDKRAVVARVGGFAEGVGARRQTVARIESTVDELLMNALLDAPAAYARSRLARGTAVPPARDFAPHAALRYGCDGRYFAISVTDDYGLLDKQVLLDSLLRARSERGRPVEGSDGGAGLGLYMIMASVTRFIVNIAPGKRTEVIGLIDLKAQGREASSCARSLHIFTAGES